MKKLFAVSLCAAILFATSVSPWGPGARSVPAINGPFGIGLSPAQAADFRARAPKRPVTLRAGNLANMAAVEGHFYRFAAQAANHKISGLEFAKALNALPDGYLRENGVSQTHLFAARLLVDYVKCGSEEERNTLLLRFSRTHGLMSANAKKLRAAAEKLQEAAALEELLSFHDRLQMEGDLTRRIQELNRRYENNLAADGENISPVEMPEIFAGPQLQFLDLTTNLPIHKTPIGQTFTARAPGLLEQALEASGLDDDIRYFLAKFGAQPVASFRETNSVQWRVPKANFDDFRWELAARNYRFETEARLKRIEADVRAKLSPPQAFAYVSLALPEERRFTDYAFHQEPLKLNRALRSAGIDPEIFERRKARVLVADAFANSLTLRLPKSEQAQLVRDLRSIGLDSVKFTTLASKPYELMAAYEKSRAVEMINTHALALLAAPTSLLAALTGLGGPTLAAIAFGVFWTAATDYGLSDRVSFENAAWKSSLGLWGALTGIAFLTAFYNLSSWTFVFPAVLSALGLWLDRRQNGGRGFPFLWSMDFDSPLQAELREGAGGQASVIEMQTESFNIKFALTDPNAPTSASPQPGAPSLDARKTGELLMTLQTWLSSNPSNRWLHAFNQMLHRQLGKTGTL
ncbi:MAG: hypothetical protein HY611_05335 [Elusimicrobia bacterium]|nr:hypothetical protein [Elusimicrobiota bacterium]